MAIKRLKRGWLGKETKLKVTSPYGYRLHPILRVRKFHNGIDFGVPENTNIYAPCDGSVKRGKDNVSGLYITLKGAGGLQLSFCHLNSVSKTGSVKEGDLIAKTGGKRGNSNAGRSTGPHLHLGIKVNGRQANPANFLSDELTGKVRQSSFGAELVRMPMVGETATEDQEEFTIDLTDEKLYQQENDISGDVDESATEEDIIVETEFQDGLASGIWQIIKLVMDTNVANLRLRDAATSIQQGSLSTFFQKVCQKPFVEFSGDTFGDQYYFLVRKPPFDKDGMYDALVAQGMFKKEGDSITPTFESLDGTDSGTSKKAITVYDIDNDDILSSNISFNNQGIYSWYQFFPIYEMGAQNDLQYIVPAVLFPEYAAIYGSRDLQVRSQYRSFINPEIYDKQKASDKTQQGDFEVRHSIQDLHYIIESNAYNPFVRQGTIQLLGNRQIKRGTFVRINWEHFRSAEIFYVESVSQNYSISQNSVTRTTTLTLSHGMMENFIYENADESVMLSEGSIFYPTYFNLINFGDDYDTVKDDITMAKWSECISKWKVNIGVFKFFMRKMQFLESSQPLGVEIVAKRKS